MAFVAEKMTMVSVISTKATLAFIDGTPSWTAGFLDRVDEDLLTGRSSSPVSIAESKKAAGHLRTAARRVRKLNV
jgi:hypothetical protein